MKMLLERSKRLESLISWISSFLRIGLMGSRKGIVWSVLGPILAAKFASTGCRRRNCTEWSRKWFIRRNKPSLWFVIFFLHWVDNLNLLCSLNRSRKRVRNRSRIIIITRGCKCRFICRCRCKVLLKVCPPCKDRNKGCLIVWWGRLTMCKGPQASYTVLVASLFPIT